MSIGTTAKPPATPAQLPGANMPGLACCGNGYALWCHDSQRKGLLTRGSAVVSIGATAAATKRFLLIRCRDADHEIAAKRYAIKNAGGYVVRGFATVKELQAAFIADALTYAGKKCAPGLRGMLAASK